MQDLVSFDEETFRTILDSLALYQTIDNDTEKQCVDAFRSYKSKLVYDLPSNDVEDRMEMDEEEWEEAKDVFFMLRVPFEVDLTEESKEKFSKAIMKRHRKRGRYGPQGGFPVH